MTDTLADPLVAFLRPNTKRPATRHAAGFSLAKQYWLPTNERRRGKPLGQSGFKDLVAV
jgi:hypothetical protein